MALTDDVKTNDDNIIDINLEGVSRTKFRINGDPTAIIELNLSDLGIIDRMEKGLKRLDDEVARIASLDNEDEDLSINMEQIDKEMREIVDYIFNSPVSAVCARYGTMYDPKNGMLRYETIIDGLTRLYTDNINAEYKKIQNRIKKHTDKYTSSATKKKRK